MTRSRQLLKNGFESSCYKTPDFIAFSKTFKSEFTTELKAIGAKLTDFNVGHFFVSGFFSINGKCFYFSLSDVRGMEFQDDIDLLYRKANNNSDFQGGQNQYVKLEKCMGCKMNLQ